MLQKKIVTNYTYPSATFSYGLLVPKITPVEIVAIGQTVTKVKLLYLARIPAITFIIYRVLMVV